MNETIKKVYDQYRHLDRVLCDQKYMSRDDFSGQILYDLWQAVKSAQPPNAAEDNYEAMHTLSEIRESL